ncbi:MAG: hypothetical protein AAF914_02225 [Pseudomonadota bacterium]
MRTICCLVVFVVLSGCANVDTFYAPNVSIASRDATLAQCEASAFASFPIERVTRQSPPRYYPGRVICNADGRCVRQLGFYRPGTITTTDVNLAPRRRAVTGCMATEGFTLITLPPCQSDGPVAVQTTMPTLTPQSCAIRRGATDALVVTP